LSKSFKIFYDDFFYELEIYGLTIFKKIKNITSNMSNN